MIGSTALSNLFPSAAHHWRVLRESWAAENDRARNRQARLDHEFLPAALEIIDTPPSPGLRWLLLTLCSLFAIAILWACIGKVDVVAVAPGKVVPSGNVKVLQAIEIGAVRAIHVRNGQHVKKGQLLIELDPTLAGADEAQASQNLLSANVARARNSALLAHLDGASAPFKAPDGASPETIKTQRRFIKTRIAEFEAERASLQEARAEQMAQLIAAQAEVTKLESTLPLVDQQLAGRKELTDKGYFSKLKLLEFQQLRIEHVQNIRVQQANASKARAAIANLDAQLIKLKETFGKGVASDLSEAEDKSSLAAEEVRKSGRKREFQQLRAPVDGTVQQLVVTTVGGVVQPAQALLVIVPDDSAIEVEAQILNRDVGFIRQGQPVRVKLEAFPFTDFGLLEGVVESVSRDAIDQGQQGQDRGSAGNSKPGNLVYAARIRLKQTSLNISGKRQLIGPGLAVQAEIKTGERTIIRYLLSPIAQSLDEAGRER